MFTLSGSQKFQLYNEPVDMRKSFDGLSGLVFQDTMGKELGSMVYVFVNKRRDKIKRLHWVGSRYLLYYKRLEEGTFEIPSYELKQVLIQLSYTQIVMLIDGVSIVNINQRKRFLSKLGLIKPVTKCCLKVPLGKQLLIC